MWDKLSHDIPSVVTRTPSVVGSDAENGPLTEHTTRADALVRFPGPIPWCAHAGIR
jgi:hypothetical protein